MNTKKDGKNSERNLPIRLSQWDIVRYAPSCGGEQLIAGIVISGESALHREYCIVNILTINPNQGSRAGFPNFDESSELHLDIDYELIQTVERSRINEVIGGIPHDYRPYIINSLLLRQGWLPPLLTAFEKRTMPISSWQEGTI